MDLLIFTTNIREPPLVAPPFPSKSSPPHLHRPTPDKPKVTN